MIEWPSEWHRRRFFEKVVPGSLPRNRFLGRCFLWTGAKNQHGYGQVRIDRRAYLSSHVVFFIATGNWPENNVLHKCDNTSCVRDTHLFDGTQKANIDDMIAKGRHGGGAKPGEGHFNAILTDEIVREMRRLRANNVTKADIAAIFNVSVATVKDVVTRRRWRHV